MAGVKGRSGTNKGKDKIWADALRVAVMRDGEDGRKRLFALADRCVDAALAGDIQAIKEIGDRLDGKPAQAVEMSGTLGISHEDALNELDDGGTERSDDAARTDDQNKA